MKIYTCPNCAASSYSPLPSCPDCGCKLSRTQWGTREEPAPPKPSVSNRVELIGDIGRIIFRRHALPMEIGSPLLASVSSDSRFAARVQFTLIWEGGSCFIQPASTPVPNRTCVEGEPLVSSRELQQGQCVCLRGKSGKSAMHLLALYFA